MPYRTALACLMFLGLPFPVAAQPIGTTDLMDVAPGDGLYRRLLGSVGNGSSGVPVAGGFDMDKDGDRDYAMTAMRASPQGRFSAGQVFLVFGDGQAIGVVDTADSDPRVLKIHGDQVQENAGSEIWMADVTGDGFGELIICRQNYSPDQDRIGAGALTMIFPDEALRTISRAVEIAGDSYRIYVGAGTYGEGVTTDRQGRPARYLRIIADIDGRYTGDAGQVAKDAVWSVA